MIIVHINDNLGEDRPGILLVIGRDCVPGRMMRTDPVPFRYKYV
jgi:hypothetical protein